MNDKILDNLMKQGLSLSQGVIAETLVTYSVLNSLLLNVVLQQSLEIKKMIANEPVIKDEIEKEVHSIVDQLTDQATRVKNDWLARYAK